MTKQELHSVRGKARMLLDQLDNMLVRASNATQEPAWISDFDVSYCARLSLSIWVELSKYTDPEEGA